MNRKRTFCLLVLAALALGFALLTPSLLRHKRAIGLLSSMSTEDRERVPSMGRPVIDLVSASGKPIPAREYGPAREHASQIIVLGHGIHHLGISEPRLRRFAEHLAAEGCYVLTPELTELASYRITEEGAEALSASVAYAAKGGEKVGLIGFSFAGGMALLAAARPAVAAQLDYVASIGGYHDLGRTLRYLASHVVEGPNGSVPRHAHDYGMLVLLGEHLDHFELGEDREIFAAALLGWLKEDRKTARSFAAQLKTERGKALFQMIEKEQLHQLKGEVLSLLAEKKPALAVLSPAKRLSTIGTRVLLLHGSGDSVVPREETEWAALELKSSSVSHLTLVTPLLEHVNVDHPAGPYQKWELIHFMAQLL